MRDLRSHSWLSVLALAYESILYGSSPLVDSASESVPSNVENGSFRS